MKRRSTSQLYRYCLQGFLFICAFSTYALNAVAQQYNARAITLFASEQPPFEYLDSQNKPAGHMITLTDELFSTLNWSASYEFNSVNRGSKLLLDGIYDISTAVSPNHKIRSKFLVSALPLYTIKLSLIRQSKTPTINDINKFKNIEYAAISQNNFHFIDEWLNDPNKLNNRYNVETFEQGIRLVMLNKIAYFLTYFDANIASITNNLNQDILMEEPVHFIISKRHPEGKELMQTLDTAMRK